MNNEVLSNINNLSTLFITICNLKQFIVKLQSEELANFKHLFYNLNFPEWQLNLIWELIWDDRSLIEVVLVFSGKKLLKAGDVLGKINRPEEKKDNC